MSPPDISSMASSPSSPGHAARSSHQSQHSQHSSSTPSPPAHGTPPPHSLAATAAMNAGIQNEESRRPPGGGSIRRDVERARRRSSIRMNLNLNDPTVPPPGEMQMSPGARARGAAGLLPSPRHERAPSLGELHQELEYEQEGQVNRLLSMIRQQQAQIVALQSSNPPGHGSTAGAVGLATNTHSAVFDDSTPTSERSLSLPQSALASQASLASSLPLQTQPRSPYSSSAAARDWSRGSSRTNSPMMRPTSGDSTDWPVVRDESAFYQAETQNLTRENQMLKLRIRELERQVADVHSSSAVGPHSPLAPSNLRTGPAANGATGEAAPGSSA